MWLADAPPVLTFAGAAWPYGPARIEVALSLGPSTEHRARVEAPGEGLVLLVDPSLPAPSDEGPLAVEACALRRAASRRAGGLPALVVRVSGPRPPEPGAALAIERALEALLAAAGLAPPPAEARPGPAGPGVAWLAEHLLLFEDPLVPKGAVAFQAAGEPGPTPWPHETPAPDLDAAALARDARAVAGALAPIASLPGASWRERNLTVDLVAAGLAARWRLGRSPGGGRLGLALAAPGRAQDLEAALAHRGHAPRSITLDPPPPRAWVAQDGGTS